MHGPQVIIVMVLITLLVWLPQAEALFDIRVIDTDAQSYNNRTPRDVIKTAENEKKLSTPERVRTEELSSPRFVSRLTVYLDRVK